MYDMSEVDELIQEILRFKKANSEAGLLLRQKEFALERCNDYYRGLVCSSGSDEEHARTLDGLLKAWKRALPNREFSEFMDDDLLPDADDFSDP